MKQITCMLLLAAIALSCNTGYKTKYPYSLKDFRPALRQQLESALSQELYGRDTTESFLEQHATPEELKKLALSEHPLLRYKALRAIERRKDMDRFAVVMNHLDDTAWVVIDAGEFGTWPRRVSDHMIMFASWDSQALRDKTVEKVLLNHNYLEMAYRALDLLPVQEKYYSSIREMAGRHRPGFSDETSYALYALAAFKKKEDIPLIQQMLDTNSYQLNSRSFRLMQQYPDTLYMPVLIKYGKHQLISEIRQHGINAPAREYFDCIASYKNKQAADMYDVLVKKLRQLYCVSDSASYQSMSRDAYWKNKCEAYTTVIKKIKPIIEAEERQREIERKKYGNDSIYIEVPPHQETKEVGWFN